MTEYVAPKAVRIADADGSASARTSPRGTDGHAVGFVQLQRPHARHVDGRGPISAGVGRRRLRTSAERVRRWVTDCPVRATSESPSASVAWSAPRRASGSRSANECVVEDGLTCHRQAPASRCPTDRAVRPASLSGAPTSYSSQQLGHRHGRGPARTTPVWGRPNEDPAQATIAVSCYVRVERLSFAWRANRA